MIARSHDFALVDNYTCEYVEAGHWWSHTHTLTLSLATMRLVVCFLSLLTVFGPAECGNVLVWFSDGSHWLNLKIVLKTLIDRGHNVTVLVPDASLFMKAKESDRFSYQPFNASVDEQEVRDFIEELVYFSVYETDELNLLQFLMKFYNLASKLQDVCTSYCDGILKSSKLMDKLRNGKFDIVLSDPMYPCSDIVAEELNVPLVYTFRLSIANVLERMCGQLPAPPSFVPGVMSKLTDKMSFTERIKNMLFYLSQDFFATIAWRKFDNYYTEYLGELKESPTVHPIMKLPPLFIYSLHVVTCWSATGLQ